jgi:tRNA-modifying protein YgfZ
LPSTESLAGSGASPSVGEVAARAGALIVLEGERGILSVTGSERTTWLNAVVTSDTASVSADRAQFGLLLTKQGKIRTDFYLLDAGERLLLAVAAGTTEAVQAELDRMLVMEDVELSDVSNELAVSSLHGPRALELARAEAVRSGGTAALLDRTGLGGAVLVVPRTALHPAVVRLESDGARLSRGDDWPSVRVPHGVGIFGVDYGPHDNPHEAALDRRAIAWNKGCYLGQEAVFMQDARGKVKRRLVVLKAAGLTELPTGLTIQRPNGEELGRVTSTTVRAGDLFALAMVAAPDFEPGTEVLIGGAPARVVARAFETGAPDAPTARQTV